MNRERALKAIPSSYQAHLATLVHLETLTQSGLRELVSKARSGDPYTQYLLAVVYGASSQCW